MQIQPIQPTNNLQFGRSYHTRIVRNSPYSKKVIDTVTLNNYNTLIISKEYYGDRIMNKLAYLKDKTGEWVKSKLTFYNSNGKRNYVKTTQRAKEIMNEN